MTPGNPGRGRCATVIGVAKPLRVLVVGLGHMGMSHALAYARIPGFEVAGLCARGVSTVALPAGIAATPTFSSFERALAAVRPDVVSINTFPDTHAAFAIQSLEAGAHVFLEKPIAETIEDAERVVATAARTRRKLVVGYILRHHPSWIRFVEIARTLGTPLVFRMNLNQQSSGPQWATHQRLMSSVSPIVDCGVHYVDVWCQITAAPPRRVHAVGARLTNDLPGGMYNYGHLQVTFEDGSVGWYEAGWGPMMSETAFFVKDVIGPRGSVSIVLASDVDPVRSDDINAHTRTNQILLHHAELAPDGSFARADERLSTADEPSHDDLCEREQRFLLRAIEDDLDLSSHLQDAVNSLRIVLAADRSVRTGQVIALS
jgi:predicted dehydrogenase